MKILIENFGKNGKFSFPKKMEKSAFSKWK